MGVTKVFLFVVVPFLCCLTLPAIGQELAQSATDIIKASPIVPEKKHNTTTSTTTSTTSTTSTTTTTEAPTPPVPPTPPKPVPPVPPTPAPLPGPPELGAWAFTNSTDNVTCIVVQFAAQLNVTYSTTINNETTMASTILNVPANASVVNGSCGETEQWMMVAWPNDTAANSLYLHYMLNVTTRQYHLHFFNVSLIPDERFPNNTFNDTLRLSHAGWEWAAPLQASFRCARSRLALSERAGAGAGAGVAALALARLRAQAFRSAADRTFGAARDCGGGEVPDAVPIAVGCALGGLVLVVLVAYLVGRRRSAARGYLSM